MEFMSSQIATQKGSKEFFKWRSPWHFPSILLVSVCCWRDCSAKMRGSTKKEEDIESAKQMTWRRKNWRDTRLCGEMLGLKRGPGIQHHLFLPSRPHCTVAGAVDPLKADWLSFQPYLSSPATSPTAAPGPVSFLVHPPQGTWRLLQSSMHHRNWGRLWHSVICCVGLNAPPQLPHVLKRIIIALTSQGQCESLYLQST